MTFRFTSRASTELAEAINASSGQMRVTPGTGGRFPALGAGQKFAAVLTDETGASEIVVATNRADDLIGITRGQEGSAAQAWRVGSRFELRATSMVFESFLQRAGDRMEGDLDLNGNRLVNAQLNDIKATSLSSPRYRNEADTATNELILPNDATRYPTLGRRIILIASMLANVVFPYRGSAATMPAWFVLCDGQNGTPDLRGRFIIGVNAQTPLNAIGGSASRTTSPAGEHDHSGITDNYTLSTGNLPVIDFATNIRNEGNGTGPIEQSGDIHFTKVTGGGQPHRHGIDSDGEHSHDYITLPPYFALAYVMFRPEFLANQ